MLIAVFMFFFTQKLLLKAFFSTTLVVLYHSKAQEFENKSFGFNPSPAIPKLIWRTNLKQAMRKSCLHTGFEPAAFGLPVHCSTT